MMDETVPVCAYCGRPSRFTRGDVYQCKPDCETTARLDADYIAAVGQLENATAALQNIRQRTVTMTAPPPPEDNLEDPMPEDMGTGADLTGVDGSDEGGAASASVEPDLTVEIPGPQKPKPKPRATRRKRAAV